MNLPSISLFWNAQSRNESCFDLVKDFFSPDFWKLKTRYTLFAFFSGYFVERCRWQGTDFSTPSHTPWCSPTTPSPTKELTAPILSHLCLLGGGYHLSCERFHIPNHTENKPAAPEWTLTLKCDLFFPLQKVGHFGKSACRPCCVHWTPKAVIRVRDTATGFSNHIFCRN